MAKDYSDARIAKLIEYSRDLLLTAKAVRADAQRLAASAKRHRPERRGCVTERCRYSTTCASSDGST
jgi:hypothetical protein